MNQYNWFERLMGFNEKDFNYTLDEIPKEHIDKMGKFNTCSIKELKAMIFENEKFNKKNTNNKLQIYVRNSNNNIDIFDTSAIQFSAKENSLFQVASNFNCMEVPNVYYDVFNGKYITQMMTDKTQGPSAAGGAAFGVISRLIEHKIKNINLLEDTSIESINGKVYYSNKIESNFDRDLIKIGLHQNVMANFLRTNKFKYNENGPRINQVFTSTCICNNNKPNKLSRTLLESAYEGTYLSAIMTEAPEVILTLVGGGVFNNSHQIICDVIMEMHNKYSPYLAKGCVVKLPIYEPNPVNILEYLHGHKNIEINTIN